MARVTTGDERNDEGRSVPAAYRGVWRRTLLRDAQGREDRATRVFWMQTARLHVDIRVPADRPDVGGATGLDDDALTRDALIALARQQGFAGITQVERGEPEVCTWQRQIDFSAPTDARDIGTMRFVSPDVVLEDGIDAHYHERWERERASAGANWARCVTREAARAAGLLKASERDGDDLYASTAPACFIARSGNVFLFARTRTAAADALLAPHRNRALADVVADPRVPLDHARAMLDFEISLGHVAHPDRERWTIALSTLPWREGKTAFDERSLAAFGLDARDLAEPGATPPVLSLFAPSPTETEER
jgi:hypothetical protein